MIKVQEYRREQLRNNTARRLMNLTLGDEGMMKRTFLWRQDKIRWVIIARDSHKKVVGWGIVFDNIHFYIYVDPPHRQQKVGTLIAQHARKLLGQTMRCYPHDGPSYSFYDNLKRLGGREYIRTY